MIKRIGYVILYWTWCLPQTLLGSMVFLFFKLTDKKLVVKNYQAQSVLVISTKMRGGLSLGMFLFSGKYDEPFATHLAKHEYGHCIQSMILGWLYLIVIGLPSLGWAMVHGLSRFRDQSYYSFYTEHWANKLGKTE